jgi:hypothetical protein
MKAFADQTLTCVECGQAFAWVAEEQRIYAERGLPHTPKRCPSCRAARQARLLEPPWPVGGDGRRAVSDFADQPRMCIECGEAFTWLREEQRYYAEHRFVAPRRCVACRVTKRVRAQQRTEPVRGDSPLRGGRET